MSRDLYRDLYKSYQLLAALQADFPVNHNPLVYIFGPLIAEQSHKLQRLLVLLQQNPVPVDQLREELSVLYRSNEAFEPTYNAWIRVSGWMDLTNPAILLQKKKLSRDFRNALTAAVPSIEKIYGHEETRYMIPPLFRFTSK